MIVSYKNHYSIQSLHISCLQSEPVHDMSSIFDGDINLNNHLKLPEFKIRLLLVIPFLKIYIITSRGYFLHIFSWLPSLRYL